MARGLSFSLFAVLLLTFTDFKIAFGNLPFLYILSTVGLYHENLYSHYFTPQSLIFVGFRKLMLLIFSRLIVVMSE